MGEYFFNWNGDAGDENDIRLIELVDLSYAKGGSDRVYRGGAEVEQGCPRRLQVKARHFHSRAVLGAHLVPASHLILLFAFPSNH